jgi:hypothetical protein
MPFLIVDDATTMRRIIINTLNKVACRDCAESSKGCEGIDRLVFVELIPTRNRP